ncbi:MAG: D-alanine--D-alanine ligase [Candidatus Doudnabacteria bacterium]|nr:D-alanine--D-alanine ligase [Candidatus Doudnabacteria bacterium]
MAKKLKIALIFGGTSQEREVSLMSAKTILQTLDKSKYAVTPVEVSRTNNWLQQIEKIHKKIDVAFLALHGPGGEDGTIQGVLDLLGVKYTCSGVLASAAAMDKQITKKLVVSGGMPVLPDVLVNKETFKKHKNQLSKILGMVVVKPNRLGSSIGVNIVSGNSIAQAVGKALLQSEDVIIEPFIEGREITVPVWGNQKLQALPVVEIVPWDKSQFYDYAAKYTNGGSNHIIPAPLSKQQTAHVQELAIMAHHVLGCRGITRSDFILDQKNNFWFLETNTIPGMTPTSLAPQSAQAAGFDFRNFLDKLIQLALNKE